LASGGTAATEVGRGALDHRRGERREFAVGFGLALRAVYLLVPSEDEFLEPVPAARAFIVI
jgi:hypothetical protein